MYSFLQNIVKGHFRYLTNLSATFLSQAVSALSILILTPILVNQLGASQYSIYGVILNLIIFSSVFDFGLNIGLLRKLIHNKNEREQLVNSMFFFFIISFLISIPIYFYLFKLGIVKAGNQAFFTPVFVALIVTQNILAALFDVIIQSVNKIFASKIIRIVRTIIEFIAILFVCKLGSMSYLLITTGVINFFYLIALFLYSKKEVNYKIAIQQFRLSVIWIHFKYSFWYFQNTFATVMVFNAQIILMSNFIDTINVARFLVVKSFLDVVGTGMANFTMVLFPTLSSLQSEGNWQKLKKMYLTVLLRVSLLVIVVFTILLTIGEKFFLMWSHYNDEVIVQLFRLYGFYLALIIIEHVPTVFLSALKFNKWPSIVATFQGILLLVLNYLFLPKFGIVGAVWASLIALFLTNLFFNPLYLYNKISLQKSQITNQ